MREINFGFDAVRIRTRRTSRLRGTLTFSTGTEVCADFIGFVVFQRTGMRLLLSDACFQQHVQNRFAFDFQFSCQIVDSNFTHPPLLSVVTAQWLVSKLD